MGLTVKAYTSGNMLNAAERSTGSESTQKAKKNVFAADLNLANDPVAQRRKEAREQAWNVVSNAWKNDQSVDDSIQARRDHYAQMEQLKKEAVDALEDVNEDEMVLQKLYSVAEDSEEQQDLELLKKEQDIKNGVTHTVLTEEERERLQEIHENPLTEYQTRALELNDRAGNYKLQIADADRKMQDDTADIHSIKRERLKSDPMLEAQQAAEEILAAANEDIKGMLVSDAVDYIDEKLEETEEKAEAAREEKEEQEERLDELALKRALQEALMEGTKESVEKAKAIERRSEAPDIEVQDMVDIAKGDNASRDVGQSLDDIKSSMKLLEADLKGIKIDEEV